MSDLRTFLKHGTADSHNRIDARMGSLDLTTIEGLGRFLSAHYLVQSLFDPLLNDAEKPGFLRELERDFDALGVALPHWTNVPEALPFHELGYRYVVTGSQLGGRLLYRDWDRATDPTVRAARHYMSANLESRKWRALMRRMQNELLDEAQRHAVLASANRVFEVFDMAATQLGVEA